MADPRTLVLVDKIAEMLLEITVANGFQQDVAHVHRLDVVPAEVLPNTVLIEPVRSVHQVEKVAQTAHNVLYVSLVGILSGWGDRIGRTERFGADMRKHLMQRFATDRWDGLAVNLTPILTLPYTDSRWGMEVSGVRFELAVQYREAELDPYAAP